MLTGCAFHEYHCLVLATDGRLCAEPSDTFSALAFSCQGDSWSDRALLLSLTSASGADVDQAQATTIVSAAPQEHFQLTFEAAINQVSGTSAVSRFGVCTTTRRLSVCRNAAAQTQLF